MRTSSSSLGFSGRERSRRSSSNRNRSRLTRTDPADKDFPNQSFLGAEVIVDGRQIHLGFCRNGADRNPIDAKLGKESFSRIQNLISGVGGQEEIQFKQTKELNHTYERIDRQGMS